MWRLVKHGWHVVTEVHTISWVLFDLFGITVPSTWLYVWATELGLLSGPIIGAGAIIVLCLSTLTWLAVVGYKNSPNEGPPTVSKSFDVVSFSRDDGVVLPNSTNATNVLKKAPNVFIANLGKPIDHFTICNAMTNTPTLQKFEVDPTGTALKLTWPTNIELPETLSVRIEK